MKNFDDRFQRNRQKTSKMAKNGGLTPIFSETRFFSKTGLCHFCCNNVLDLHAKNSKNLMSSYWDIQRRTDGHTDERTRVITKDPCLVNPGSKIDLGLKKGEFWPKSTFWSKLAPDMSLVTPRWFSSKSENCWKCCGRYP